LSRLVKAILNILGFVVELVIMVIATIAFRCFHRAWSASQLQLITLSVNKGKKMLCCTEKRGGGRGGGGEGKREKGFIAS